MKTNKLMDEIRETMSPEMKKQMELSVLIANRIYEILDRRGMSQKDLAKLLGKSETEVSRWLSGMHNMTISTIAKVSLALGEDIIGPIPSEPVPRPRRTAVATPKPDPKAVPAYC